jgi:hypothetical protein
MTSLGIVLMVTGLALLGFLALRRRVGPQPAI